MQRLPRRGGAGMLGCCLALTGLLTIGQQASAGSFQVLFNFPAAGAYFHSAPLAMLLGPGSSP